LNPYQPPSADESQLDRLERKIDRLDGSYLLTLIMGGAFTAMVFLLVEIISAR